MPRPAVFLDRDGVINRPTGIPHAYIASWDDFEFLPHVFEGLQLLQNAGYLLLVVTNQRGVARGLISQQQITLMHTKMREALSEAKIELDGIYVCPHDVGQCDCRKPKIGLFEQAARDYTIDRSHSYMIGDSDTDMEAGRNFGISTVFIGTEPDFDTAPDFVSADLLEAAHMILKENAR